MIRQIMTATILWWGVAAVIPVHARLQNDDPTLGSLWLQVKENYVGVGVQDASVAAARLHNKAVKHAQLPEVKAQAQNTYGTYTGTPGAFFPQEGFFNVSGGAGTVEGSSLTPNSFGSATISWEVFAFGKRQNESAAADQLLQKSMSERAAYLLHLRKMLSERYVRLLYSAARLHWAMQNTERLRQIREITAGLAAAGLRPAADSLLATASYVQAKGAQDKWAGKEAAALIRLQELSGTDHIDYAASVRRFRNPQTDRASAPAVVDMLHPALRALQQEADYYRLSGIARKKAALPSLRLLGGYAYRGTGISDRGVASGVWSDGFHHATHNVIAGIGITWELSGLYTDRIEAAARIQQSAQSKLKYQQVEQQLQSGLAATEVNIRRQYDQIGKTRQAVEQSRAAYDRYLARYRSGLISLSELLQIRLLLEQAENTHIEASRDLWMLLVEQAGLTANFDFLFHNL